MVTEQAILAASEKLRKVSLNASPLGHDHLKEKDRQKDGNDKEVVNAALPEELQDLVLARLPLLSLYKARPVCKRWNSLLVHPPFLKLRGEIRGKQDAAFFPLLFWRDDDPTPGVPHPENGAQRGDTERGVAPGGGLPSPSDRSEDGKSRTDSMTWSWLGYDSETSNWQAMKPFATPAHARKVITGSKGLICLRGDNCLLVINPMTGAQREVPLKENVVQLVVASDRDAFKIICAGSRKRTKIYDSETRAWSKRGRPAPNLALSPHTGAFCDGVLYCVAREERSGMWGVTGYAVEGTHTWTDLSFFPVRPGDMCLKAKVVQHGGAVFALLEMENGEDDVGPRTKGLSIWKLERESMKWAPAGTMPWSSRQHLVNLDDFDCVAFDDRICVFNKGTFKAVECRSSGGSGSVTSWHHLPLDSYFATGVPPVEHLTVHFAFEPSLLASV